MKQLLNLSTPPMSTAEEWAESSLVPIDILKVRDLRLEVSSKNKITAKVVWVNGFACPSTAATRRLASEDTNGGVSSFHF